MDGEDPMAMEDQVQDGVVEVLLTKDGVNKEVLDLGDHFLQEGLEVQVDLVDQEWVSIIFKAVLQASKVVKAHGATTAVEVMNQEYQVKTRHLPERKVEKVQVVDSNRIKETETIIKTFHLSEVDHQVEASPPGIIMES